jgi:hypothetical protein
MDGAKPKTAIATVAKVVAGISLLIVPFNLGAFAVGEFGAFFALSCAQVVTGGFATLLAIVALIGEKPKPPTMMIITLIAGVLLGLGGLVALLALAAVASLGGAWGRPLRVRGRILHPNLRAGADWTQGARPTVTDLDMPTRIALEALWLHDAQKEHASVPAFSRISWQLAAVGAPAELLEWSHQAAMEEIDHARRCFALAAGYGGRSHTVEAMPDLLIGGLDTKGDPLVVMALESLKDGCLLEDFNSDVAGECEKACLDPATKDVLARITREERSHAELSWSMVAWLAERGGDRVRDALEKAGRELESIPRPTAVSGEKAPLVAAANPAKLRAHGRIEDARWAELWTVRIRETRVRLTALLLGEAKATLSRAA